MAMLFMDPLDLWLMLLGVTLFAAACAVFLNVVREKRNDDCNKGLGAYFMGVGIYALVAGLWGMMTWPLPGSNNIVLIDSYALFGIASLVVGVVLYKGLDIRAAGAIAPLGLPAIVYAFVIWSYGMTREPLEAGLMFFLTGLAALLSPLLAVQRVGRILGIVAVIILVVAGIMAFYTGLNAAFGHVARWAQWVPWYGSVTVGG